MKKILFFLVLINMTKLSAQDVLNPYIDYSQYPNYPDFPLYNNLFGMPIYSHYSSNNNAGYTGEYEILLGVIPFEWETYFPNLYKTYSIESVSFPFSPPCAFQGGCIGTAPIRELYMPADPYDEIYSKWGYLTNKMLEPGIFDHHQLGTPPLATHQDLVSYAYVQNLPIPASSTDYYLPHTILKHTVSIHCGFLYTDDIIASISWYYDNTRGQMRTYPFNNQNSASGPNTYDIIFFPDIVNSLYILDANGNSTFDYGNTFNNGLENYETINNFPYTQITNLSNCPLSVADIPNFNNGGFGNLVYPSDNILISAPARTSDGYFLAGFNYQDVSTPNGDHVTKMDGIKQIYFIDKGYPDLDLNWINPSEKIIFNPSEVTVKSLNSTLVDLRFPTLYTFKTILGVYPSVQEATQANTAANGGPYTELKDVPVPVNAYDLLPSGGNQNNYPEVSWNDPTTTIDDRYGYYYIDNLGQISVEPCVKIFDAKFEVRQGGTLLFEDYTQTKNPDRFSITGLGGAIAKNFLNIQYLQNSIITQPQHIPYIAVNEIYAGTNVDPSPNTTSPYVLESGSDVEFIAGQNIYLKDGFSAKAGSKFHAHISASSQPTCPSGWRIADNSNNSKKETNHFIGISPNPSKSNVTIECKTISNGNLFVYDITGREMLNQHFDLKTDLELSKFTPGMFVVRIQDEHGVSVQGKMIVQK